MLAQMQWNLTAWKHGNRRIPTLRPPKLKLIRTERNGRRRRQSWLIKSSPDNRWLFETRPLVWKLKRGYGWCSHNLYLVYLPFSRKSGQSRLWWIRWSIVLKMKWLLVWIWRRGYAGCCHNLYLVYLPLCFFLSITFFLFVFDEFSRIIFWQILEF